jgi:hypothetical protein
MYVLIKSEIFPKDPRLYKTEVIKSFGSFNAKTRALSLVFNGFIGGIACGIFVAILALIPFCIIGIPILAIFSGLD